MLNAYLAQFAALIQAPSSPTPLISTAQATTYINAARLQVASEGECIRAPANLTLAINQQSYAISSATPSGAGIASALSVRMGWLNSLTLLDFRAWEWFGAYYLESGSKGPPVRFALQGQGTAGTIFFDPVPAAPGTVLFDAACLPVSLVDDSTVEAIPYPWTDAVPFWAAWLGMQSVQRQADAEFMMQRYQVLMRRARDESSPSVLPENLPGDIGTKLAAAKTTLTEAQAPGRA